MTYYNWNLIANGGKIDVAPLVFLFLILVIVGLVIVAVIADRVQKKRSRQQPADAGTRETSTTDEETESQEDLWERAKKYRRQLREVAVVVAGLLGAAALLISLSFVLNDGRAFWGWDALLFAVGVVFVIRAIVVSVGILEVFISGDKSWDTAGGRVHETYRCPHCLKQIHLWDIPQTGERMECPNCHRTIRTI